MVGRWIALGTLVTSLGAACLVDCTGSGGSAGGGEDAGTCVPSSTSITSEVTSVTDGSAVCGSCIQGACGSELTTCANDCTCNTDSVQALACLQGLGGSASLSAESACVAPLASSTDPTVISLGDCLLGCAGPCAGAPTDAGCGGDASISALLHTGSGACESCLASSCSAQATTCSTDCSCNGPAVDAVECLANLGSNATVAASSACVAPLVAAGLSDPALYGLGKCVLDSCATQCGSADGGADAGPVSGNDAGGNDAGVDATVDSGAPPIDAGTDGADSAEPEDAGTDAPVVTCSAGTFEPEQSYSTWNEGTGLTVGDFNGDGQPDLAEAQYFSNSVSVLLSAGGATFGPATSYPAGSEPNAVVTADFNGDDVLDLAVVDYVSTNLDDHTPGTVAILLGAPDGGAFGAPTTYTVGATPTAIAVGDVNGDGKPDLAVTNSNRYADGSGGIQWPTTGTVSVLVNSGSGTFTSGGTRSIGTGPGAVVLAPFDVGDGGLVDAGASGAGRFDDIAVFNSVDGTIGVLKNTGGGSFLAMTTITVMTAQSTTSGSAFGPLVAADMNRDGKPDLVVNTQSSFTVLLNTGGATFGTPATTTVSLGSLAVEDFDGDGYPDVATVLSGIDLFLNTGNGTTFQTPIPSDSNVTTRNTSWSFAAWYLQSQQPALGLVDLDPGGVGHPPLPDGGCAVCNVGVVVECPPDGG